MEYETGHTGYPMYGNGVVAYDSDTASRVLEGGSKWVEIEYSPDTEKTLLNESKASSIEKWVETDYPVDADKTTPSNSKNPIADTEANEKVRFFIIS